MTEQIDLDELDRLYRPAGSVLADRHPDAPMARSIFGGLDQDAWSDCALCGRSGWETNDPDTSSLPPSDPPWFPHEEGCPAVFVDAVLAVWPQISAALRERESLRTELHGQWEDNHAERCAPGVPCLRTNTAIGCLLPLPDILKRHTNLGER